MGYTMYWSFKEDIPQDVFDKFRIEVDSKLDNSLLDHYQNMRDYICFNDPDDMGESFVFTWRKRRGFCKTDRLPYTKNVLTVLRLAKLHFRDRFSATSDGPVEIEGIMEDIGGIVTERTSLRGGHPGTMFGR